MKKGFLSTLAAACNRNRGLFVLVSLLLYLVAAPVLKPFFSIRLLLDIFITLIFISVIYAASEKKWHYVTTTSLTIIAVGSVWGREFFPGDTLYLVSQIAMILYFLFAGFRIVAIVIKTKRVAANVIYSAIVVYLIAGFFWAEAYTVTELLQPGSFNLGDFDIRQDSYRMTYFSFVTLTTLGYGDVSPVSATASALTILEAIFGQMYITVLIAWLVGRYISESKSPAALNEAHTPRESEGHEH